MNEPTDALRKAVEVAIRESCFASSGQLAWSDNANAAIRAYEAHRPRPVVVLTSGEWAEAILRSYHMPHDVTGRNLRAAFPWIKVEGE